MDEEEWLADRRDKAAITKRFTDYYVVATRDVPDGEEPWETLFVCCKARLPTLMRGGNLLASRVAVASLNGLTLRLRGKGDVRHGRAKIQQLVDDWEQHNADAPILDSETLIPFLVKRNWAIPIQVFEQTEPERQRTLLDLVAEALATDGDHHKQWYLQRIAEMLGMDTSEYSVDIVPREPEEDAVVDTYRVIESGHESGHESGQWSVKTPCMQCDGGMIRGGGLAPKGMPLSVEVRCEACGQRYTLEVMVL